MTITNPFPMAKPHIRRFVELSLDHVPASERKEIANPGSMRYSNYPLSSGCGAFVWCNDDQGMMQDEGFPPEVIKLFSWARFHEADYICFDADTDPTEGLPVFRPTPSCEDCDDQRYLVCTRPNGFDAIEACDACNPDAGQAGHLDDPDAAELAAHDGIAALHAYPCYVVGRIAKACRR